MKRRMSEARLPPEATAPVEAEQLSVSTCSHGNVHVKMLDALGQVFAYATLDPTTATLFWNNVGVAIERVAGDPKPALN